VENVASENSAKMFVAVTENVGGEESLSKKAQKSGEWKKNFSRV
jgi:hypothetical protein